MTDMKRKDDFAHDLKMFKDEGAPAVDNGETVTEELGD